MRTRLSQVKACPRRPRSLSSRLAHVAPPGKQQSSASSKAEHPLSDQSSRDAKQDAKPNPPKDTKFSAIAHQNAFVAAASKARKSVTAVTTSNSVKYLIAGAIAGIVSRTAVSPLEVVATVNMCTSGTAPPLLRQLRVLLQTEGLRGFFKGNAANCLKVAPTKGIQFVAFEALKRVLFRLREGRHPGANAKPLSAWERFIAGGLAGMTAATMCYPLDTAKTLLTAHPERFSGVLQTMLAFSRQQGPRALYRGLSPTLVAMMPYAGLDFAIYEQLKLIYMRRNNKEANLVILLVIGAFAGAVAQTACHPLDVVRKRLQLQGIGGRPVLYRSMLHAASGIVKKEGPLALYRGLQPMYISAIPSAGVSYVVYETVKKALGVRSFP
ncbi:Mitochondrial carrier [Gracilaria domingensis]|nr:Mitochondrial carrier [Gracilaria domingensis]